MQGRVVNAGRMVRPCGQSRGRMVKAGPYVQCRAVCSMQGRVLNAGPYAQCRAVCSMQGRMFNAGPCGQCRAVCSMQGRILNAGPYAQCRAAIWAEVPFWLFRFGSGHSVRRTPSQRFMLQPSQVEPVPVSCVAISLPMMSFS